MKKTSIREWAEEKGFAVKPSWQDGFFEIRNQLGYPVCRKGYESAQQFSSERAAYCKLSSMRLNREREITKRVNAPIYLGD